MGDSTSWVYYSRLQRDAVIHKARPKLMDTYEEGISAVGSAHFSVSFLAATQSGVALINMANAEAAKEQALLAQIFGVQIGIDFSQPGTIQNLIDTLNACLNLKSVYERNKALITNWQGKKGVFSYFHTYLNRIFTEYMPTIQNEVLQNFVRGEEFYSAVKTVIDHYFYDIIVPQAIKEMLSTADAGQDDKYLTAYQDIINAIEGLPHNPLAEGLKQAWGLSSITNRMIQELSEIKSKKGINNYFEKGRVNGIKNAISGKYTNNASGLSLEALYDQITAMVASGIPNFSVSSGNFTLQGGVTGTSLKGLGQKQMRPDNSVIFNADATPVEKMLEENTSHKRDDAINLFNQIGQYIDKVNNGFIVYTNAKNYQLNAKFGGYSAGAAISLFDLEGRLGRFIDNVDDLIMVLINAGKGAIAEGDTGEASHILAQAIAYALFDDWDFIGVSGGSGKAIHVMNLNGVLIPLSVFLYSLGKAIDDAAKNPEGFVSVSISPASYDVSTEGSYGMSKWNQNITFGKQNTKIKYHFMKNITSFLKF